jgi:putative peptide zinc metalloprotease protein
MNPATSQFALGLGERHAPKVRSDLLWKAHDGYWVVQDPIALSYFYFEDLEYAAAQLMHGRGTLRGLLQELQQRFPMQQIDMQWLVALVGRLRGLHLLAPTRPVETESLISAYGSSLARTAWQPLLSPLAIRIPLFNPQALLLRLRVIADLLFDSRLIWAVVLMAPVAALLVFRQWLQIGSSIVQSNIASLTTADWLTLLVCYLIAKSLHELGHGLASSRQRVACTELGLMLLCFVPCLYCDTTDSWKLRSKWQRAQIAAAGMYVELWLAILAAVIWLITRDGWVHYTAGAMMIVCSLATIMVNANPLLRFDGYYILSDLWGIPNLAQRSREALDEIVYRFVTGQRNDDRDFSGKQLGLLVAYALASAAYRLFVLAVVLWLVWMSLSPRGLGLLSLAISSTVVGGVVFQQLGTILRTGRRLSRAARVRYTRIALLLVLLAAVGMLVVAVPLPSYVRARAVTHYRDKLPLYAARSGIMVECAATGRLHARGTKLFVLEAPQLELEKEILQGELDAVSQNLAQLQQRASTDPLAAYQLPIAQERLSELQARSLVVDSELEALTQHAPFEGYLLEAGNHAAQHLAGGKTEAFPRQFLDNSNRGSAVERSQLMGWFVRGDARQLQAIVPADQARLLKAGMLTRLRWDRTVTEMLTGRISRIASEPIASVPGQLIGDAHLPSERNEQGAFRTPTPHYEVIIEVHETKSGSGSSGPGWIGAPASVRIQVASKTLLQRLAEFARRHFNRI